MTLEEFLKTIAYFSDTYYYNPVTTSHDAVEKCWEFRQSEIDELKSRISKLEEELQESRKHEVNINRLIGVNHG